MWKPFVNQDKILETKEAYQFFLVRPIRQHPVSGGKHCPSVVQMIEGKLFTPNNELEPIIWSHQDDVWAPTTNPYDAGLEWTEIPE